MVAFTTQYGSFESIKAMLLEGNLCLIKRFEKKLLLIINNLQPQKYCDKINQP